MKDFKKNYLLFLLIAFIFVVTIGFFSYGKYRESSLRGQVTQDSNLTLKKINQFKILLFQSLSEQREYLITGQPEHLDIYMYDRFRASGLIDTLVNEASSESQKNRARQIAEDFNELVRPMDARDFFIIRGEFIKKINTREWRDAQIDLIRNIDAMTEEENAIFDARLDSLINLNRNFYIAVAIGSFAALAVLMYMNYYLLVLQNREADIQKKFEELKERQAQSFQATRDGLFEWDLKNQTMYWSPRLKEMIGYGEDELKSSPETLEQLMHPEDRENFWKEIHEHLRGEIPEHSAFFRWKHKNNYWIWINSRGQAIFNEFGDPFKLIGVHTDVTKLKEYELQMAKSRDEAEKANSAKSDFLAHMSHEIRTPLTAITGVAEILNLQNEKFDEKTRKLLGALNASAIGLKDLINDILDFSKIESGKIALEDRSIDLVEFFAQLNAIVSVKAQEKSLELTFDDSAVRGLQITGDQTRIRQILINLIGNAIKFTNKGQVSVRAEKISAGLQDVLTITVSDTGIGIAAENLPYIFDSFKQADASISRKFGGTGLGLPIARKLAQLMGGSISVVSKIGEGSEFTLFLPVNSKAAEPQEDVIHQSLVEEKLNLGPEDKILVVEDYEGNIAFISHILNEMGVRYDLGRTGLEGLKLWSDNAYKLVLMDIQMPEMDGISAVKHIRTIEDEKSLSRTPVIAMTAHAFSEDRAKCLAAGFDEYLAKPLSKKSLFEKMSTLIDKV